MKSQGQPDKNNNGRKPTGVVYSDIFLQHATGPGHPESPQRVDAVIRALKSGNLEESLVWLEPRKANRDDVLLVHTPEYFDLVEKECAAGMPVLSTGDTTICSKTFEVALYAVGALLEATDKVIAGTLKNAFCPVRPPGHHASPDRGMGFCVFNNVAVAARYARERHGAEKMLIVDWDVHHGNGTQDTFFSDPSVLYFSTHRYPWYPGTGKKAESGVGAAKGSTLNCPLPSGSGKKEFLEAFKHCLIPAANAFQPDFVLISAGFDSRISDPLGGCFLDDDDFSVLTMIVIDIAEKHANGRLVSALEGGYNLEGLGSACKAHVAGLVGIADKGEG